MERLIVDNLSRHKDIHDWTLTSVRENEAQAYLIGENPEGLRRVDSTSYVLRIFNDHDGYRGDSAITIPGTDSIDDKLDEAIFAAGLVQNPPYQLPSPNVYPSVLIKDEGLTGNNQAILNNVRKEACSAIARCGVRLSSLEVYISEREIGLKTSKGVDVKRGETIISIDMVLISKDGKEESEKHVECTRRKLKDISFDSIIDENARFAMDSLKATLPETGEFPVVISKDALIPFFSPFIFHASGNAKYKKLSRFEKGEYISGKAGNRLTLKGSTIYPFGNNSSPFDEEGLPGNEITIIEDGRFVRYWAAKRFADWLGIEATGPFGNIIIEPGNTPIDAMLKGSGGTVYHIVEFSWMNPDPVTGKFVGEIRLGYKINGNKISPVKGGAVMGNVFEAMGAATFSKEEVFLGGFYGPQAIRVERLSIAGG